ncbi:MAG: PEP-CTERM sorting domain-containing protein [Candidatus Omnitrophica bacterium]|nr:PEP-CTERM sorting domain-containing protein [Candidatus Omnitrophota bacterium]MDD5670502.1 PEP-CTERM sorting domain-containing protein [Candidatus Omnitrophota bacterium]
MKTFLFSLVVLTAFFAQPVHANVLGSWDFDQTSGTTLPDVSGNGNTGVLQNMTDSNWVPGIFGNALSFNGIDQWVDFPSTSAAIHSLNGAMTVELWLKANASDQKDIALIFDKSHGFYGHNGWCFQYVKADQTLQFAFGNLVGWIDVRAKNVFDGEWHYVAGTYDMSYLKLYVDGELKASLPSSYVQGTNPRPLEMGSSLYSGTRYRYFAGSLDDVALYDVALDAEIIKQHATLIPEPSTLILLSLGLFGFPIIRRKK